MKKVLLCLLTASLLITKLEAEENQNAMSVTASSSIANKYLNVSTGGVLSEDPVIQTDLLLTHKNGLYVDLWNSTSLNGNWNQGDLGDELDIGIGWNGTGKGLVLHVGVTYLDEPKLFSLGVGDIVYTHVRIGKGFRPLTLTFGYENYTPLPESGFQGGNLVGLGCSKTFSFCEDKINLNTSLAGVYDTGTLGSETGFFLRGNAGLNWLVTKNFTINAMSISYYIRRQSDCMVSTGLSWSF
jgi:hypothetical protein